MSISST